MRRYTLKIVFNLYSIDKLNMDSFRFLQPIGILLLSEVFLFLYEIEKKVLVIN